MRWFSERKMLERYGECKRCEVEVLQSGKLISLR